jgi:hypothetical protein
MSWGQDRSTGTGRAARRLQECAAASASLRCSLVLMAAPASMASRLRASWLGRKLSQQGLGLASPEVLRQIGEDMRRLHAQGVKTLRVRAKPGANPDAGSATGKWVAKPPGRQLVTRASKEIPVNQQPLAASMLPASVCLRWRECPRPAFRWPWHLRSAQSETRPGHTERAPAAGLWPCPGPGRE